MQSDYRKRRAARERRAESLSERLRPVCEALGLQQDGTSVYCPTTKRWRVYKSVAKLLNDCRKGEYGEATAVKYMMEVNRTAAGS